MFISEYGNHSHRFKDDSDLGKARKVCACCPWKREIEWRHQREAEDPRFAGVKHGLDGGLSASPKAS